MISDRCVPKLCGADVELANFVLGRLDSDESIRDASQSLLAAIAGISGARCRMQLGEVDPQDRSRAFLPTTGGCAYIDLDHLELCLPEVLSAWDFVAAWHALLRLTQDAQQMVNATRDDSRRVQVLANNSDGRGHSYGSHLNILMSRAGWNSVVQRKPHYLAFLAAFQASSIPLTGQGKVGAENGSPPVTFQLSQRADFIETMMGSQTTAYRPLVNTRDEPLAGRRGRSQPGLARLHVIFHDSTLCHVATLLKVGTTQLIAAMIEAEAVDPALALDDPLVAVRDWSRDVSLDARAALVSGARVTSLELQRRFLDAAAAFVASGRADGVVPRAGELVALWDGTLTQLERRDWTALARRLDWVLKLSLIERAFRQQPQLDWASPGIKYLDHLYSSLDRAEGLYWNVSDAGGVDEVVSSSEVERFGAEPPADTRAWGRAALQRAAGGWIEDVDWDCVRLRLRTGREASDVWRVDLSDPLGATRADWEQVWSPGDTLREIAAALGAVREIPPRPPPDDTSSPPVRHGRRWNTPITPIDRGIPGWPGRRSLDNGQGGE
jgi:proteasome accessory factor A